MPYGIIYHVIHPKEPERVRYVGKTKAGIKTRENGHWSDTNRRRSNSRLQNWLVKYRADRGSIEFRPVIECDTPEELNAAEIREIARLRSIGQADLNITSGGDGGLGLPWSEESRSKLSKTLGGEGAWKAKGTWELIGQIRQEYLAGATRRELVERYPQFATSTMQKILRNGTWRDENYLPPDRAEQVRRRDFVANAILSPDQIRELRDRATRERKQFKEWAEEYGTRLNTARLILQNRSFPDPDFDPGLVLRARSVRSDLGVRRIQ